MIKPLRDMIAVEHIEAPGKVGLLYIPDVTKSTKNQTFHRAKVLAVGREVATVKPTDVVMISEYAGDPFTVDGKTVHLMRERDIVGIVTE